MNFKTKCGVITAISRVIVGFFYLFGVLLSIFSNAGFLFSGNNYVDFLWLDIRSDDRSF